MTTDIVNNIFQSFHSMYDLQTEPLTFVHLRRHENQRTVSTDGPRVRFFFKRRSEDVLPGDPHWDGHQYALTPSAVCREPGGLAGFGKPRCKGATLPGLNGGEHQAHALVSSGVDDSCTGFKQLGTFCDAHVGDRP